MPTLEDEVLEDLHAAAEAHPEYPMLPFRALASGRQYRRLYELMRRYVPAGAAVLDWGAGSGHFSYYLVRAGYRATGYSLLDFRFDHLVPPSSGYRFVRGDPSEPARLPFASASFDAVVSVGVLEHVRETGGSEARSLAEIARILRPGGVFVCYHFPNRTSWIDRAARLVPGFHRHEFRYTRKQIEALNEAAGFRVLESVLYGALPRNGWHALPRPLRKSRRAADLWDALDAALSKGLAPICQNHYFVSRRGSGSGPERRPEAAVLRREGAAVERPEAAP
jgi:SAM-dependent methyltransferase